MKSFIDAVLTNMTTGKKKANKVASLIQSGKKDGPVTRIYMVFHALAKQSGPIAKQLPNTHPVYMTFFIKMLMNHVARTALKYSRAQHTVLSVDHLEGVNFDAVNGVEVPDGRHDAEAMNTGRDFSEDTATNIGVPCMTQDEIVLAVENDFALLRRLMQAMTGVLGFGDELALFSDDVPLEDDNGRTEWVTIASADTFAEAAALIDIANERFKQGEESRRKDLCNKLVDINFDKIEAA